MATVNVSVTPTKIDITSITDGPATWVEVVTVVNNHTAGTITGTGTSGDPYIITTPSNYRELEISAGHVQIAADTFIKWGTLTTSSTVIDLQTNALLTVGEGCSIDWSDRGTNVAYANIYGSLKMNGTALKPIAWKGHYRTYFYLRNANGYTMDYVNFESHHSSYAMYFAGYSGQEEYTVINFNNCTFQNTINSTKISWLLTRSGSFVNVKFENCEFYDHIYAGLIYTGCIEYKNCTFDDGNNHCIYAPGGGRSVGFDHATYNEPSTTPKGSLQPYVILDGCTFKNINSGDYGYYGGYGAQALVWNCDFQSGNRPMYSVQNSRTLIQGNTITTTNTEKLWSSNGTYIYVWEIDITVEDEAGDPIEGAVVSMIQSEGKEHHTGYTNSSGQVRTLTGRKPVLGEKEEYSSENYDQWSDSEANGRYHQIIVSKVGYKTEQVNVEMTEDRTMTIVLRRDFKAVMTSEEPILI